MANRSCGGDQQQCRTAPVRQTAGVSGFSEPPVRRWPHPVEGTEPAQTEDPALHYINCALSYQNQLLADIKTLLEQLAAGDAGKEK